MGAVGEAVSLRDTIRGCLSSHDQAAAKSGQPVKRRPTVVEDDGGDEYLDQGDQDGGVPKSPQTDEFYQGQPGSLERHGVVLDLVRKARGVGHKGQPYG